MTAPEHQPDNEHETLDAEDAEETQEEPLGFETPTEEHPDGVRLQKVMAAAGVGSRRVSEDLIAAGRVRVNGVVVTEPGRRVDPIADKIAVDNTAVQLDTTKRYVMLNKPVGIVSSMKDGRGRPDLTQFTDEFEERLFNVGRLDAETSGLLILTNDGDLAHVLAHPSFGVDKTYIAKVTGRVTPQTIATLTRGIELEDGPIAADRARLLAGQPEGGAASLVEITLHSGRNRIVRRMLEAVGHPVEELVRRQFGPLHLGSLPVGRTRHLTRDELGSLLTLSRAAQAPDAAAPGDSPKRASKPREERAAKAESSSHSNDKSRDERPSAQLRDRSQPQDFNPSQGRERSRDSRPPRAGKPTSDREGGRDARPPREGGDRYDRGGSRDARPPREGDRPRGQWRDRDQPQDRDRSRDARPPHQGGDRYDRGGSRDARPPREGDRPRGQWRDRDQPQDRGSARDSRPPREGGDRYDRGGSRDARPPREGDRPRGQWRDRDQLQDRDRSRDARPPQDRGERYDPHRSRDARPPRDDDRPRGSWRDREQPQRNRSDDPRRSRDDQPQRNRSDDPRRSRDEHNDRPDRNDRGDRTGRPDRNDRPSREYPVHNRSDDQRRPRDDEQRPYRSRDASQPPARSPRSNPRDNRPPHDGPRSTPRRDRDGS